MKFGNCIHSTPLNMGSRSFLETETTECPMYNTHAGGSRKLNT